MLTADSHRSSDIGGSAAGGIEVGENDRGRWAETAFTDHGRVVVQLIHEPPESLAEQHR
ncbi:hypothetical protein [Glaciihabitans sp. INWT7]|uniref:hypothetical protein n=1 Tax=Glaciihabitans sp. INWT7 TaxID=2596912 RepID=UPI0021041EF6|nr:hypothetical protein [Glaciihabitans sp. INWT7]